MRWIIPVLCLVALATPGFAGERWILISGTVSNFHTDARIFNPSFDKDIQISATFLPTGNVDNSARTAVSVTVPKRQMRILDDVTTELFATNALGAIRLTSSDEFEITSRIYAQTAAGTLGQFGPGLPTDSAKAKGAVLQLKANGSRGQTGTFRANIGAVNPSSATVTVTWTLYDTNNAIISSGTTSMPPMAVIAPTEVRSGFFFDPKGADLSNAWISYSTSPATPIFVYASALDNGTEDQTFIPAVDDKGTPPPPVSNEKTFDVTLQDFSITFSPALTGLKVGDKVRLRLTNLEGTHGFTLVGPNGQALVPTGGPLPVGQTMEANFTIEASGTHGYFCTNSLCGSGHGAMNGSFTVGQSDGPDGPGRGGY